MGGHGGLNILPQKRWNVYRFDNQEKVRVDEAEAARQDQLQREATRRRESHSRLVALRRNRGLQADSPSPPRAPPSSVRSADQVAPPPPPATRPADPLPIASDGDHINLFSGGGGAADFAALASASGGRGAAREREPAADSKPNPKKRKKEEEEVRTAGPDDEKYRLGYGLAGKGIAAPWYASKPLASSSKERRDYAEGNGEKRNGGKKSIEELREERRKREAKEKERERALLATTSRKKERQPDRGYSSRYVR